MLNTSALFEIVKDGSIPVKNNLENCGNEEVVQHIPDIHFDTPKLFIE